jgi:hypothetical protein
MPVDQSELAIGIATSVLGFGSTLIAVGVT